MRSPKLVPLLLSAEYCQPINDSGHQLTTRGWPAACRISPHAWQLLVGTRVSRGRLSPSDNGRVKPPPVTELIKRRDGKLYPAVPRTPAEHRQVVALIHNMRHLDGLSYPQVQRALLERHGVRRSLGMIWRDANEFRCPNCVAGPVEAPAPAEAPRPAPARCRCPRHRRRARGPGLRCSRGGD